MFSDFLVLLARLHDAISRPRDYRHLFSRYIIAAAERAKSSEPITSGTRRPGYRRRSLPARPEAARTANSSGAEHASACTRAASSRRDAPRRVTRDHRRSFPRRFVSSRAITSVTSPRVRDGWSINPRGGLRSSFTGHVWLQLFEGNSNL